MKKKILSFLTMICMTVALLSSNIAVFAETSGTCGNNLTWNLDSSGTLTVSGTGAMTNYTYYDETPWYSSSYSIKSVVIEDGVTSIGDWAFSYCDSLTSVTIGNSVTSIGTNAFYGCNSLTNIAIPNSVTGIGIYAFSDCQSLTSITIPNSVTSIGDSAFRNCSSLTNITIPDSVTTINSFAFSGCNNLTSITVPDSVKSIGNYAFYNCSKLTSITIPDSVTSIGFYAFDNTGYYNNVSNWENDVLYVGNYLIQAKSTVVSCKIKSGTKCIANSAFSNCNNLTSVTIPDSITSIGNYAFCSCSRLTSITIPDSVTSIGDSAFASCYLLADVYYSGSETDWNNIDICSGNDYLKNATITYLSNTKTTVSDDGKTFIVKPINIAKGNTVILALYNGNTFVGMEEPKIYNGENLTFTTNKAYTNAKIMVWNSLDGMQPQCEAENIE